MHGKCNAVNPPRVMHFSALYSSNIFLNKDKISSSAVGTKAEVSNYKNRHYVQVICKAIAHLQLFNKHSCKCK